MMLDSNSLGVILGVTGTAVYIVMMLIRYQKCKPMDSGVVFIAIVAVVAGCEILYVAVTGDLQKLPSNWRAYLGVAGVVCITLSLQPLFNKMLMAFSVHPKPKKTRK